MGKRILVVETSLRQSSNSSLLAEMFANGAAHDDNLVEILYLKQKELNFCRGCLSCQKTNKCVIDDGDLLKILVVEKNMYMKARRQ